MIVNAMIKDYYLVGYLDNLINIYFFYKKHATLQHLNKPGKQGRE